MRLCWQWLVKWFLAIPHLLVLALLWMATAALTVVAWFAILITGSYPRGIFDFSVGVLRWTRRVQFYAFNVLGTDRYPPFSLEADPDYPAHLAVDYPAALSRTLVPVKWILTIPHPAHRGADRRSPVLILGRRAVGGHRGRRPSWAAAFSACSPWWPW